MSSKHPEKAVPEQAPHDFFDLPNLCQAQALFFLILIAQLLVLVQSLSVSKLFDFDWLHFGLLSFYVLWNVLLCAGLLCVLRPLIARFNKRRGAIFAWTVLVMVSAALSILVEYSLGQFQDETRLPMDWSLAATRTLVAALMGGLALRYLYLQQQVQVQQQAHLQAHIAALQSRIRPHFLFNSMNIVASLIGSDPKRAETVVEDISELFRASLRAGDELVALENEINLCRQYISIEQLRLGDRLKVHWDIAPEHLGVLVPSLTLQPLIENAVYHGIQPLAKGGEVRIQSWLEDDHFRLEVRNPAPPEGEQRSKNTQGNQIALANTEARLRAHFGDSAKVKTYSRNQCFFAELGYSVKK